MTKPKIPFPEYVEDVDEMIVILNAEYRAKTLGEAADIILNDYEMPAGFLQQLARQWLIEALARERHPERYLEEVDDVDDE